MNFKKVVVSLILGGILIALVMAPLVARDKKMPGSGGSVFDSESIGVVRIEGQLADDLGTNWMTGSGSLRNIMDSLRQAAADPATKVVLLRINSPGGSAAAGQEIAREVGRLKESGKLVVVSMGDVTASAGYLIAAGADRIVANPATLTGSIGAYMEFQNFAGLMDMLGIESEIIKSGTHKDMGSASRSLTDQERAIAQSIVDDSYQQFIEAVATGRGDRISREKLVEIADGRVLTGRQAKDLGLVDDLGNFYDAVQIAADLAGLEGEPQLKEYTVASPWSWLF